MRPGSVRAAFFYALGRCDFRHARLMTNPLFRTEVLDQARQQGLGVVRLVRPVSLTVLTAVAVAMAVASGAFLWLGQTTRKVRVDGVVVPDRGLIRVMPAIAGVVQERFVTQGQAVQRGERMFVLSLVEPTLAAPQQEKVRESLQERERSLRASLSDQGELLRQGLAAANQRLADLRRETAQIQAEIEVHQRRRKLAEEAAARAQSLQAQGYVSEAQVQARLDDELMIQGQIATLERQVTAHQRDLQAVEAEIREMPLKDRVRRGELERELASLDENSARSDVQDASRRVVVRAPSDGTVAAVMAEVGQPTAADVALASVLPQDAQLQAHLFAPSRAIGFLRPGQSVSLRLQAFPHQKFGTPQGRIVQVSNAPWVPPADDPEASVAAAGEPVYRIIVALPNQSLQAYGQRFALVAGMRLEADVALERRRLIEWLFEPLLGWAGRL